MGIYITYLPMKHGFMYLCIIIDVYTRYVVGWGISNTMTAQWCCEIVQQAIATYGKPEIINSDQRCQFISNTYVQLLENEAYKSVWIAREG